tara:strand:+ start:241 stop:585 length:345 start_codon:yes stop_codon:yes gene_type:complete
MTMKKQSSIGVTTQCTPLDKRGARDSKASNLESLLQDNIDMMPVNTTMGQTMEFPPETFVVMPDGEQAIDQLSLKNFIDGDTSAFINGYNRPLQNQLSGDDIQNVEDYTDFQKQ